MLPCFLLAYSSIMSESYVFIFKTMTTKYHYFLYFPQSLAVFKTLSALNKYQGTEEQVGPAIEPKSHNSLLTAVPSYIMFLRA